MPLTLLIFGLSCAAAVGISLYPPPRPGVVALAGWFVGWIIGELPLHHIALQLGVGVWMVASGGLEAWPGWLGLGALGVSLAGLCQHVTLAARTSGAIETALNQALGPDYRQTIGAPAEDRPLPWLRLALIWPFRPRSVERLRDIEYHRYGKRKMRLDIYRSTEPVVTSPLRPVFVFVHGGGWVIGNKGQQGRLINHELAAQGWIGVSVEYRLSPRATFPDHLLDVKRALAWVKANIARYGGDPSFIVIGGGSAGGHLSSLATLTAGRPEYQPGFAEQDLSVQGCVGFYGVYDFVDDERSFPYRAFHNLVLSRIVMKRPIATARDKYQAASPVWQVHGGAPPFLMLHGDRDSLAPVAQARRFRAALTAASKAPVAWVELPGAQHAFELFPSLRSMIVIDGVRRFCQAIWQARNAAIAPHGDGERAPATSGA